MKTYHYHVEASLGHCATRYNHKKYVVLPDGTELVCGNQRQAEELKELLNAVVVTQHSPHNA